jgi:hypothetical protein
MQTQPSTYQDEEVYTLTKGFPTYNVHLGFKGTQLQPKVLNWLKVA